MRTAALDEDQLQLLADLDLPITAPGQSTALSIVQDQLRTAATNKRLRAVLFASKENRTAPGELNGRQDTIKFVHLEGVSRATLVKLAPLLREGGHTVVPYAKGLLVSLSRDDD